MLFSPRSWRQIIKPHMDRLGQFLHGHGITFWMHCCGNAEAIFEDLIECGLDVIQPLEAKSGLDVRKLRDKYGKRLTFFGNIDVRIMADGTDEDIEEEIRSKLLPSKRTEAATSTIPITLSARGQPGEVQAGARPGSEVWDLLRARCRE